jgi:beta-ribofuranosylaminobenzene 5'-phosphate synthase
LGLGATTSVVLSAIVAVLACHNRPVIKEEVIVASRRGATSGVGINGFFQAGLIVDHGRIDVPGEPLMPSERAPTKFKAAGLTARMAFPAGWPIALIKPHGERALSVDEEIAAFSQIAPVAREDSLRAIAATYHGIIPAVLKGSFQMFRTALHDLQAVGFKSAEIALRSSKLQFLLHCLRSKDVIAAGMSSFGPIVFAILESDRERPLVHDMVKTSAAGIIEWTTADNAGYVIHP